MIAILLATYNSDLFLREQIDSLLLQSIDDFSLYIRDDGSTDTTLEIIEDYVTKHSNIVFLEDPIKKRGAGGSFMWLLESIEADYYMFCDHDDYWLPNKIELTYSKMLAVEKKHPLKPILVFTDLTVVDSNLTIIADSMWSYSKINPAYAKDMYLHSVSSSVTGCTIMINKNAKKVVLPYPTIAVIHDWWIALIVAKYGIVDYIANKTILYRQHGNNEIGVQKAERKHYVDRLLGLKNTISDNIGVIKMLNHLPFRINHLKRFFFKIKVILIKLNINQQW